jgi:hypothetical protein
MTFFIELEKRTLKFIWKTTKAIPSRKSNVSAIIIPDFKTSCKAIVMKTV